VNTNGDAIGFSTKGTPRTVGVEAVSPDQAFHLLEAGNKRFREWYLAHKNQLGERRREALKDITRLLRSWRAPTYTFHRKSYSTRDLATSS